MMTDDDDASSKSVVDAFDDEDVRVSLLTAPTTLYYLFVVVRWMVGACVVAVMTAVMTTNGD